MPRASDGPGTDGNPCGPVGQARILVRDESFAVRAALLEVLHRLGVTDGEVAVAETTDEALAVFRRAPPAIVFAELVGADDDEGLDAFLAMLHAAAGTRVILLTAEPRDAPEVRAALRAGVFAYVEKPVRQDKVRQALQDVESESADLRRI